MLENTGISLMEQAHEYHLFVRVLVTSLPSVGLGRPGGDRFPPVESQRFRLPLGWLRT